MPGSEELGDAQKVLLARRPAHGDDAGVEKFPGEFQNHFHPVLLRHQNISNDQIGRSGPIEGQPLTSVGSFTDLVAIGLPATPAPAQRPYQSPQQVKRAAAIAGAEKLVRGYFRDADRAALWFVTPNPMLEGLRPRDLIERGQAGKLLHYVKEAVAKSKRPLTRRRGRRAL